jgi:Lhr-like helicase
MRWTVVCGSPNGVEQKFEWRSYLRLLSTFVTPAVVSVFHGGNEIGTVDERLFLRSDRLTDIQLAGRSWEVIKYSAKAARAHVRPCDQPSKTTWLGLPAILSFELCHTYDFVGILR